MDNKQIRDMGINSTFFNTVPSVPFQRVVDAWRNWQVAKAGTTQSRKGGLVA